MSVRSRLIQATMDLVRRCGVSGTGVAQVLAVSGVSRRGLYLNFPGGKNELVAETTRVAGELADTVIRPLVAADDPPVEALIGFWSSLLTDSDYTSGCPVVAAALSRDEFPDAADAAGEVFDRWVRTIAEGLRLHGVAHNDSLALATTFVATIEGAVILAQSRQSTAPLDYARIHLEYLLRGYAEPSRRHRVKSAVKQ